MKKQKNRKFNFQTLAKSAREAILKSSVNIIVIALFLFVAFLITKAYLLRSDYFRLGRVEIKETFLDQRSLASIKSRIMNAYPNRSLFELNLKAIARDLQNSYPDAKDISVALALPDKLIVNLKLRKPVAVVRADRRYAVDEEGVILPVADAASLKWVPMVDGVNVRLEDRRARQITSKNLKAAIDLLREIKDIKIVADFGVDAVDARNLANLVFYLKNGIEIRMGGEDFKERLITLAKTLRDPRLIMERIKYVDLRFGDAVIGPR